jgi:hypothetical protein
LVAASGSDDGDGALLPLATGDDDSVAEGLAELLFLLLPHAATISARITTSSNVSDLLPVFKQVSLLYNCNIGRDEVFYNDKDYHYQYHIAHFNIKEIVLQILSFQRWPLWIRPLIRILPIYISELKLNHVPCPQSRLS